MLADVYFSVPLPVVLSNGVIRTFDSVHDTLDFLENEWPLRQGERYKRACERCQAALHRMTPVAVAREAFISACLEAGLPVQSLPPTWHRSGPSSPSRMSA